MPNSLVLVNRHTGERLELRRVTDNGRTSLALWGSLPPRRQGPPLHVHVEEVEEFRVIAGTLSASVNGKPIQVGAGGTATFPAGVAHRWWNDGDETLILEGSITPVVDFDRYVQGTFDVLNSSPPERPSMFYMAHLSQRHRRTQVGLFLPRAVQAVLFPLVVFVGTLLGRYRGTRWPGSPSTTPGTEG